MLDSSTPNNVTHSPNTATVQTVMGLDYGINKMGIALGNTLTQTATPLRQFAMKNGQPDWVALLALISEWQAQRVIVGLPLNMDGTDSELGNRAKKFARRLNHELKAAHIACPVTLADERLTSREAKRLAWEYGLIKHEHEPIDAIASAIMLGSWLRHGQGETLP